MIFFLISILHEYAISDFQFDCFNVEGGVTCCCWWQKNKEMNSVAKLNQCCFWKVNQFLGGNIRNHLKNGKWTKSCQLNHFSKSSFL
jgi:hypothetical protein